MSGNSNLLYPNFTTSTARQLAMEDTKPLTKKQRHQRNKERQHDTEIRVVKDPCDQQAIEDLRFWRREAKR